MTHPRVPLSHDTLTLADPTGHTHSYTITRT
jgi:hypothetical protein